MEVIPVLLCCLGILLVVNPSFQNAIIRNGRCYEQTWQCYGAHTAKERDYWLPSQGPMTYVDGQETTTITGHVAELEYAATITGVEVTFFIMELDDTKTEENKLKIIYSFSHTANKTGLNKIPLDLEVKAKSRIGFEVRTGDQIPMNHRPGKIDGTSYTSFIGTPEASDRRVFRSTSVNQQYNFRICLDLALDEVKCRFTALPIMDPCSPDPCINGECVPDSHTDEGYSCRCDRGYAGDRCDRNIGPCYRKYWQCYGGHTSMPTQFPYASRGNIAYVDGQSTTTMSGHVSELEYVAEITGVEVRFKVLQLDRNAGVNEVDGLPREHILRVTHRVYHTANKTGLIKIPVDWEVRRESRIGFEVFGKNTQVPMRYRLGKPDGGHYKSFLGQAGSPDYQVYPEKSVNMQFNFRMCFDLSRDEVWCPYTW